jgi:hypothetical protein
MFYLLALGSRDNLGGLPDFSTSMDMTRPGLSSGLPTALEVGRGWYLQSNPQGLEVPSQLGFSIHILVRYLMIL